MHETGQENIPTPKKTRKEIMINLAYNNLTEDKIVPPKQGSRHNFNIWSQNVWGLKDSIQLEHAIVQMIEHQIDAFLLQETWIKGDSVKKVREHTTFMHGLDHHNSGRS